MAIATDSGSPLTGSAVNDAYGSKTAAANTEITRVIPPRPNARAKVSGFMYKNGANAHILTFLVSLSDTTVSTDAAAAQAVVAFTAIPTAVDGSPLAAGDWVVLQHENGTWGEYKVASLSGLSVTLTNLSAKVLKGAKIFFMGAPGDHPDRQYAIDASETFTVYGGDTRMCAATGTKNNEPILAHSNNVTAAGNLKWLAFTFGDAA